MLPKEFEERTGMKPTEEEFDYIHAVYMETSMEKDEFCKEFKKYGASKILRDVHVRAVNYQLEIKQNRELIEEVAEFLIGKSRAYDDTDFRRKAVRLIGEKNVVLLTIKNNIPLWEEDKEYISNILNHYGTI